MDRTNDDSGLIYEENLINKSSKIDNNINMTNDIVSPTTYRNANADINVRPGRIPFSPNGQRRPFFNRAFGKLEKGSLRGSIFSLCASAIGSGVLSLPYVLALNGWALGFILILVSAFSACWSLFMIADSAIKANVNNFSKLTNFVGGKKLELFLQINILIYMIGSCIVTTLLRNVVTQLGGSKDFTEGWEFRAIVGAPIAACILMPMSMIKDMSGFRYISFASIFALFYTGVVLLIEMPEYIQHYKDTAIIKPFIIDLNFFNGACITFFAYTCQVQLLPIYSELINPNARRIKKIIGVSVIVDVFFYMTIAAAGYFSTFDITARVVLDRPPLSGSRDYAILISQILIMMVLFVAVPVNYNPFRNQVFYMFFKRQEFSFKDSQQITILIIFQLVICSVKVSGEKYTSPSNLFKIIFFSILCVIGYINVVGAIVQMVMGIDKF
ncbi:UNKNOWN [Stylonychia lemnae]|uniref:Amino acid transporter transmembrane domain-containing protein n=1 Tax=Stylonychia lemnae TaxID=5949 RepID=A0A078AAM2_STYLE|nr:UNKNOWN [Stylonychia lemnae]|eukprot:CDW79264.1 UNKNOWN [Stylonychia lemnae]